MNVAVAVRPVVMFSVQVAAVPEQAPLQPANVESGGGDGRERDARAVGVARLAGGAAGDARRAARDRAVARAGLRDRELGGQERERRGDGLRGVSVTVQVADVPVQAPLQPVKLELAEAAAVSVTVALLAKSASQVAPHEMPAGLLVTVPLPVPAFVTVRCTGSSVNVAVTERATFSETVQVAALPLQAPLQPVKPEPAAGVAVSVTLAPFVKSACAGRAAVDARRAARDRAAARARLRDGEVHRQQRERRRDRRRRGRARRCRSTVPVQAPLQPREARAGRRGGRQRDASRRWRSRPRRSRRR